MENLFTSGYVSLDRRNIPKFNRDLFAILNYRISKIIYLVSLTLTIFLAIDAFPLRMKREEQKISRVNLFIFDFSTARAAYL